ncbi:hypothetical protein, partial [Sporosarcina luteola]|uniref:hypothetical protein n=1 Tax=Sporosarcina luteola TaxID=582850 RepID=UPI001C3FBFB4
MRGKLKIGVIFTVFLTFFLFDYSKLAIANVSDIEYDSPSFVDTEYEGEGNNDSEDTGDSRNWFEKLLDDLKEWGGDAKDYALDQWDNFKDWSSDKWDEFKGWAGDAWDSTTDWLGDRLTDIGNFFEWVWDHEWVQVVVGAVISTGVIIGGLLLVGTPVGWGILAIVGAGSLIGGGIYWLMSGDDFNFWGSLGSSFLGGLAGLGLYAGVTSGLFATIGGALRGHAIRAFAASRVFILDGLVKARLYGSLGAALIKRNIMTRVGAVWTSIKGAGAFVASKIGAGWAAIKAVGASIASKLAPNGLMAFLRLMGKSAAIGAGFSGATYLGLTPPEDWSLKGFLIDVAFGGISGAILSPVFSMAKITSKTVAFLVGYAGLENLVYERVLTGEWSWENALIGSLAGFLVVKGVAPILNAVTDKLKKIPFFGLDGAANTVDDIVMDNMTKPFGTEIREKLGEIGDQISDFIDSNSNSDPQPEPQPQ